MIEIVKLVVTDDWEENSIGNWYYQDWKDIAAKNDHVVDSEDTNNEVVDVKENEEKNYYDRGSEKRADDRV